MFLPLLLSGTNRIHLDEIQGIPTIPVLRNTLTTFFAVTVAWIFFRAENIVDAMEYIGHFASDGEVRFGKKGIILPVAIVFLEWWANPSATGGPFSRLQHYKQFIVFTGLLVLTFICGISYSNQEFIYFQF